MWRRSNTLIDLDSKFKKISVWPKTIYEKVRVKNVDRLKKVKQINYKILAKKLFQQDQKTPNENKYRLKISNSDLKNPLFVS